ncbi:MAG TPA: PD-(D/E)XK nuclease family protein, partial [Candidatus Eisenbacteria bacterium]|nr:PD-(D/E)XK nuclease family protein [Candidatus Eisenbacteria bacterium]
LFLSPTAIKRREWELAERFRPGAAPPRPEADALLLGTLAHGFLQAIDFGAPEPLEPALADYLERQEFAPGTDRGALFAELYEIFRAFFASPVFAELRSSAILGREVPLLIDWDGQIMEGVIDLLYERNGSLYIADYKTDRIARENLAPASGAYRRQAEVYRRAVSLGLGREVAAFKLIFLRLGAAVEIEPPRDRRDEEQR